MAPKLPLPAAVRTAGRDLALLLSAALFFLTVCLSSAATVKNTAIVLIFLTLSAAFLFYGKLRDRLRPPILALGLVVLMDGLSNLYAVSGKFALYEFLKVLIAFCMALLLTAFTGGRDPGRQAACVLEGFSAAAGLVSVDLLSTRWISTPVLGLLSRFTPDYTHLTAVEEGTRMTSLFMNPNVFAGIAGTGVLLSLGLAVSAEGRRARTAHLVCLFASALSFVLAFSIGACLTIVLGFLAILVLERPERRTGLLLLMLETFVLTVLAVFPISRTSLTAWSGVRLTPLLCLAGGAAALCLLDRPGQRLAARLAEKRKAVFALAGGILAGLAVFFAAACLLTGSVTLQPGEALRRSVYPKPGSYTVSSRADGRAFVLIESQNRAETMMHTSTVLYRGPLDQASFTVPEDSTVVYFSFSAEATVSVETVAYTGEAGSGKVPLGYRLLPEFAANRLQGLFANQNAIQRLVFFEDGLKLFRRSPLIGMGLGVYENGVKSVQSFHYLTKYAHNHYIQTLAETGLAGLVLFLGLLVLSAAAVWRGRREPLAPALGAALVFMAAHGAVEVVFSAYPYLPAAFGVFAAINLTCGGALPAPWMKREGVRSGMLLGICGLLAVFGLLLSCNMAAQDLSRQREDLSNLQKAVRLDRFEWADHMLAYVIRGADAGADSEVRRQADAYALRLAQLDSNVVPLYLAEYYLKTDRLAQGMEMAEKYVDYVSSDSAAWQKAFDLLARYEEDSEVYRAGVLDLASRLDAWNRENMGEITVDQKAQELIARARQ